MRWGIGRRFIIFSISLRNANSQIVFTDVIPDDTVSTNGSYYLLDLNNDSIKDFKIKVVTSNI